LDRDSIANLQRRRRGAEKPGVEEHAAAGDGTLGMEWVSISPVRAMQKACPAL